MTSNRYLTEALESSRHTLLAFVDRIAFVSFVPRGFAEKKHLDKLVESLLSKDAKLEARLTIEDVDVLQEMVDEVVVPAALSRAVVALARDFEERTGQLERSDPAFATTRYLSTRAVIRLATLLKSIVFDLAMARRSRSLRAEVADLGSLRLAMMLAGPKPADIGTLLERETESRERRQLQIMAGEAEIFSECLRALSTQEIEDAATLEEKAPDEPSAIEGEEGQRKPAEKNEPSVQERQSGKGALEREPTLQERLSKSVVALAATPGELDSIERVLKNSLALEEHDPGSRGAAESARGQALEALSQSIIVGEFSGRATPNRFALEAHLSALEKATVLRETLLAAEVADIDRVAVNERFGEALERLRSHCDSAFDTIVTAAAIPL